LLRAPASAVAGRPDRVLELAQDEALELVSREDYALQVRVEAWKGGEAPLVTWARQWSVIGERLVDVRQEGQRIKLVERPAGTVAAELRWAIVGAIDTTTDRHA
jgi:hypothetical protein